MMSNLRLNYFWGWLRNFDLKRRLLRALSTQIKQVEVIC